MGLLLFPKQPTVAKHWTKLKALIPSTENCLLISSFLFTPLSSWGKGYWSLHASSVTPLPCRPIFTQLGWMFLLVPAHPGSLDRGLLNSCVCVYCIYLILLCAVHSVVKIPRDKLFAWMNAIGMVVTALPVTINHGAVIFCFQLTVHRVH